MRTTMPLILMLTLLAGCETMRTQEPVDIDSTSMTLILDSEQADANHPLGGIEMRVPQEYAANRRTYSPYERALVFHFTEDTLTARQCHGQVAINHPNDFSSSCFWVEAAIDRQQVDNRLEITLTPIRAYEQQGMESGILPIRVPDMDAMEWQAQVARAATLVMRREITSEYSVDALQANFTRSFPIARQDTEFNTANRDNAIQIHIGLENYGLGRTALFFHPYRDGSMAQVHARLHTTEDTDTSQVRFDRMEQVLNQRLEEVKDL